MSEIEPRSEAEMVLSSVRKLVRTDNGPPEGMELPEKLLLTPAFRVDDGIEDVPTPAETEERRTPTFFRSPRRYTSLEGRIAELERAVGSQADDFEPDGSEDTDEETPKRFVFQHRSHPDAEPQGTIGSTMLGDTPSIAEDLDPPEVQVYVSPKEDLEDEPEPVHPPLDIQGAVDVDDDADIDVSMDGLIDEAALREIVSQMVRAELQGELGEKITRNVRKLVRREIHRVLLTHDFG